MVFVRFGRTISGPTSEEKVWSFMDCVGFNIEFSATFLRVVRWFVRRKFGFELVVFVRAFHLPFCRYSLACLYVHSCGFVSFQFTVGSLGSFRSWFMRCATWLQFSVGRRTSLVLLEVSVSLTLFSTQTNLSSTSCFLAEMSGCRVVFFLVSSTRTVYFKLPVDSAGFYSVIFTSSRTFLEPRSVIVTSFLADSRTLFVVYSGLCFFVSISSIPLVVVWCRRFNNVSVLFQCFFRLFELVRLYGGVVEGIIRGVTLCGGPCRCDFNIPKRVDRFRRRPIRVPPRPIRRPRRGGGNVL